MAAQTKGCNGFLPLLWPSMCGEVAAGHIYVRTDLTTSGGECFMCRMIHLAPVRDANQRDVARVLHPPKWAVDGRDAA